MALAQSADKGLSILLCRLRSLAEIERVWDDEQAMATAISTVTVEQAKKLKSGVVCKPPSGTYLELKLLIGTFCGLLYTLFGSSCDYYHELRKIHLVGSTVGLTLGGTKDGGVPTGADRGAGLEEEGVATQIIIRGQGVVV